LRKRVDRRSSGRGDDRRRRYQSGRLRFIGWSKNGTGCLTWKRHHWTRRRIHRNHLWSRLNHNRRSFQIRWGRHDDRRRRRSYRIGRRDRRGRRRHRRNRLARPRLTSNRRQRERKNNLTASHRINLHAWHANASGPGTAPVRLVHRQTRQGCRAWPVPLKAAIITKSPILGKWNPGPDSEICTECGLCVSAKLFSNSQRQTIIEHVRC